MSLALGHGLVHAEEYPLLADAVDDPGAFESSHHVAVRVGQAQLHALLFVLGDHVHHRVDPRGVHADDGTHLHDDEPNPDALPLGVLHLAHPVLHERDVREVERGVDAQDGDAGHGLRLDVLGDTAENLRPRQLAQDGRVRARRLVDDESEGNTHRERDPQLDPEQQRPDEGHDPQEQVFLMHQEEELELAGVHEAGHRGHHDGRQDRHREVVHERREEEEGEEYHDARHGPGQARLGPRVVVHRGPRERARDGVDGEEGTHKVCQAHAEELFVHVEFVVVLRGKRLGDGDGLHEAHEAHHERRGDHSAHVLPGEVG